jgi:hypothetical protein
MQAFTMTDEEIVEILEAMEANPNLITRPAYRANAELWPGNTIPFVDSHLHYIKTHPALNPEHYLSNLRLMIRRKP